jgi:hypothetical protein
VSSPVWVAINVGKLALFTRGLLIVDSVKLVATLFAVVESREDGGGAGNESALRGVFSRLIVPVSTLASAGACLEFRLITPARIAGVNVGVGVGVAGPGTV